MDTARNFAAVSVCYLHPVRNRQCGAYNPFTLGRLGHRNVAELSQTGHETGREIPKTFVPGIWPKCMRFSGFRTICAV